MKHAHLSGRTASAESKSFRPPLRVFPRQAFFGHKIEVRWSLSRVVLAHCLFQLQTQVSQDGFELESSTGKGHGYKSRSTQRMRLAEGLGMRVSVQRRRPYLSFLYLIYILDSKTSVKYHLGPQKISSIQTYKQKTGKGSLSFLGQGTSGGRLIMRKAHLP